MTETSPVSTQTRTDDTFEQQGRHRRPGRARTSRSRWSTRETGETLPRGEAGEFCTQGYSVMLGYWEQPDKTDEVLESTAGCTPATSR